MPGGLAAWLDDDGAGTTTKRTRLPRRAGAATASAVIDVDAASPGTAAAGGGKTNRLQAPAKKEAWDPFSSTGTLEDSGQDAFALLRKAAAAKQQPPITSTASSTTPSPPAWREGSRPGPASSSWDPFGAPSADGKENRMNAFSKLLAAPTSQQQQQQQQHAQKGRSAAGKRTKLNNSSSGISSGGGGSPDGEAAVTRFCECPVCGKRVIIELCSKHLDTECSGLAPGAGPPAPSPGGDDPSSAAESLPPAKLTSAPSALAVPQQTTPRQKHAASVPSSFGSPAGGGKGTGDTGGFAALLPPTPAVPASPTTVDDHGRPGNKAGCSRAIVVAEGEGAARSLPLTPAAAAAAADKSAASVRRKKSSRGAPPSRRKGRKGAAAAAVAAAGAKAMTTCPVCGQNIQADLCSWHLDNECAGANNPAPEASSVCEGKKSTDRGGGSKAGSEATGGLDALAAELTCPICLCVFEDAHSLPCSHRFCLECILGCFKSSKRQECPLCKIPAWKRDLTRDVSLQNIILAYRRMAT